LLDLPLATPELDHDALREILSPCFTTVRDEGYSPHPTGPWQPDSSTPSKEVCAGTSSVTCQPRLSTCNENPAHGFLQPKTSLLLNFSFYSRVENMLLFSSRDYSLYFVIFQISLSPRITSFLAFLNKVAWVQIPILGQAWKRYRWVPCPIFSLNLEDGLPSTSLTGNSFLGQMTVEQLHLVGTGLVRVISTILGFPHHLSHSIHGLSWQLPLLTVVQHIFNFY
jgi:hypothetical protein